MPTQSDRLGASKIKIVPSQIKSFVKSAIAVVILSQFILMQAMAASPSLHEDCHHHHHEEPKTCVVDLMLNGGYGIHVPSDMYVRLSAETPAPVPVVTAPSEIDPCHLICGLQAHAPPRGP